MIFDFAQIGPRDRHKLLTSTIIPRPIAWVSTRSADGVDNAAPFAFFNVFGENPPVLALGIHDGANGPSDTGNNIRATGEFVVNLVPRSALAQMDVTARGFAPEVDEFSEANLTKLDSVRIKPPRIGESPVAYECKLIHTVELGPSRWIAVGQVLIAHIADEAILDAGRFHIDSDKLDIVARIAGGRYAQLTEAFGP